jgi:hypothetical protein
LEHVIIDIFSEMAKAKMRVDEYKETGSVNVKVVVADGVTINNHAFSPGSSKQYQNNSPLFIVLSEGKM